MIEDKVKTFRQNLNLLFLLVCCYAYGENGFVAYMIAFYHASFIYRLFSLPAAMLEVRQNNKTIYIN